MRMAHVPDERVHDADWHDCAGAKVTYDHDRAVNFSPVESRMGEMQETNERRERKLKSENEMNA